MTVTLKHSIRNGNSPRLKISPPPPTGRRMSRERLQHWLDCQVSPFARRLASARAARNCPRSPHV